MLSAPRLNSPIVQSSPREPQAESWAKRRPFHYGIDVSEIEIEGGRDGRKSREVHGRGAGGEGRRGTVVIEWDGATVAPTGEWNETYGGGNGRAVRPTSGERVQGAAPLGSPRSYDPRQLETKTKPLKTRALLTAIVSPANVDEDGDDSVRALVRERKLTTAHTYKLLA